MTTGTEPRVVTYTLTYQVVADSRLQAIFAAGAKLRTGVVVLEMIECEQSVPGWWDVVLAVQETLGDPVEPKWLCDDPEFQDHPADATVDSEYAR